MKRRILGRTGIEVSEIAFGGVEIGMPYGIGIESEKDMLSEKDAISLLNRAIDRGINFFDTARLYGRSEEIMGKAFKGHRSQVVLCTKSAHLRDARNHYVDSNSISKVIKTSLMASLKALQTDYIDVYMLHNADIRLMSDPEVAEVFVELKKSGKVRSIAVSTYLPEETRFAIESGIWDLVQLPFNLLDQRQRSLFGLANRNKVAIVVRSVLFKGLLGEKGKNLHPKLRRVEEHIRLYSDLLDDHITNLAQLATKFALSFDEVSSVLVGIDRLEYLNNAVKTADGLYFNERKLAQAVGLAFPNPDFLDLHHWDVMGWLK